MKLGAFLLLERMGAGGMGAVYLAMDTALHRKVAIKVMKASLGEDPRLVENFLREARAAATLNHRNIVQVYSCGQESGQPYMVMELVTGGRVNELFSRTQPMDEEKLLGIAADVAEGLKAAAEVGLVHGDIKPENILLDQKGTAKIADFGLAQFVNAQKERGEIWGTPYYISPERARGNKADQRSDIYSFGATLYHMLSGEPPFDAETPVEVVLARLKRPPLPLGEVRPGLQAQTVALIERMMQVDPQLRYPNAASLRADIASALAAAREARLSSRPMGKASSKSTIVVSLVALAALAGLGLLMASWVRKAREKPAPVAFIKPTGTVEKPSVPAEPEEIELIRNDVAGPDGVTRTRITARFFTAEEEAEIASLLGRMAPGHYEEVYLGLDKLGSNMRGTYKTVFLWMPLLGVAPLLLEGDEAKASAKINAVAAQQLKQPPEHPAHMPVVLARTLAGKAPPRNIESYRGKWPSWFFDLYQYLVALQQVHQGNDKGAKENLETFLARLDDAPAWVTALRKSALEVLDGIRDAGDAAQRAEQLAAEGQFGKAQLTLNAYTAGVPDYLENLVKQTSADIGVQARKEQEARQKLQEYSQRIKIQQELDRVDENLSGLIEKAFRDLEFKNAWNSAPIKDLDMKTPEGRAALAWAREFIMAFDGMKQFLITGINESKYPRDRARDLGGDVVSANTSGIRATVDRVNFIETKWENLPLKHVIGMTRYYTEVDGLDSDKRAEALITLCLFSVINQQPDEALKYAEKAKALDSKVDARVRKLAPGLLIPGSGT